MTRSGILKGIAVLFLAGIVLSWGNHEAGAGPGGGTYYANSPSGTWTDYAGVVHNSGTPLRKFVDSLPGLGSANANNLGQYIPVAAPDQSTFPGSDYYVIGLRDYTQQMHSDLPKPTLLRGYYQINATDNSAKYLGPLIIAQENRPVRIKFENHLGVGNAGNLFIPVDNTYMGAGLGPLDNVHHYTQNRAVLHLHGGNSPWISDGTPHQWIAPVGENTTPYLKGVSQRNVPDMPAPGAGKATYYYTNQQSGRLMFYHDHAYGITRLNVYAGEAAGYLLIDNTEIGLINRGILPNQSDLGPIYTYGVPLILQDKIFVPADVAVQDALWDTTKWGQPGDLWFPHVYETNQDPNASDGANPFGRWDYGPWFWPPMDPSTLLGPLPQPSGVPEGFMDTPVVNGAAYPYLTVQPKAYRFRILNAANDRMWNLQLYYSDNTIAPGAPGYGTEVKMVPAVATDGYPASWPTDGRDGGVPDPATVGPTMIQIGTEGGILPASVTIPNQPVNYEYNRRNIVVLNVSQKALWLGPAERADVIIDFSSAPVGSTIILYNDAPAPVPAFDTRNDYYTGNPDQTEMGGGPSTLPGFGPNTRTVMQFRVVAGTPTPFNTAPLDNALAAAFVASQPTPIVPEPEHGPAYGTTFTPNYSTIEQTSMTFTPIGSTVPRTVPLLRKTIQELFELNYGRMNATLGVELPLTNFFTQTTIPLGYIDPPTEFLTDGEIQLWKITHNGVDTHAIHFHLVNVQVVNRVGWDGAIRTPDPWELGWKETVIMNPLEDVIVALLPKKMTVPAAWGILPQSVRPLDPTQPLGGTMGFAGVDPATGNPIAVTNDNTNFGYEYVWHCHLLGHEENDMMRAIVFTVPTTVPTSPNQLTATLAGTGNSRINLAWVDRSNNETGFEIQRSTGVGAFTPIAIAYTNDTTYTDVSLSPNTAYRYRIRAFNSVGNSSFSNTTTLVTTGNFPATTGVTFAAHPASPQQTGTLVNFIASATGGTGVYQYRFERLVGATWTMVRTYTLDNNWIWDTANVPAGSYSFRVLARTQGSTAASQAISGTMVYVLQSPPASAVTLAASPASPGPARAGDNVVFTAAASGGSGTYQYRFERRLVGATTWTLAADYPATNPWVWATGGVTAGNYEFRVLARNAGSTAASEAISLALPYTLGVGPATGASLSATPPSPQPSGTSVAFTAAGAGGTGVYQFQFSDNVSGVMTVVQPYSGSSAFAWNTSAVANGTYQFKVDVRSLGSTSLSEASAVANYTITSGGPATGASLSATPASPQVAGTSVAFTAAGAGGTGVYQFQFSDNVSGAMTIVQPYSGSSSFAWNTSAVANGTYQFKVDVRSQGSTSPSEASALSAYTIGVAPATGVSLSPTPAGPQPPGTSVAFIAAGSGGSGSYQYQFSDNATGAMVVTQPYSQSSAWVWNTTGAALGAYSVKVDVRSAGSTAASEASNTIAYTLTPPPATGVTLNPPSPASPQAAGTTVTWIALASGGSGTYQYQFSYRLTGTSTYTIGQGYSSSNTWAWITTAIPAGIYDILVNARSAGSMAASEASTTGTFVFTGTGAATNVVLNPPSPASPQAPGVSVTWTAVASGGSGPYQYQFWLYNGSSWSIVQAYSSSNTWTWNTSGMPTGTYSVEVWARNVGSTAGLEATTYPSDVNYVLAAPIAPATGVTFTPAPSPASPQAPGTSVTFTAAATGGAGTYQYQFWLYNGTSWSIAQAYSSSNTWIWNTTGLATGTYSVEVWARSAGSTAGFEATTYPSDVNYVLAAPIAPATGVTFTPAPSPASPQAPGTSVTFTAAATGGAGTYQYQFWLYNGTSWSIAQAYSSSNTWIWNTTGLATGTYSVEVWARSAGSTAGFEATTYPSDVNYVLQ